MAYKPGTYPSVTTILKPWADFSGIPDEILAAAAKRGTEVHAACLAEVRSLWVMPDPVIGPFLDSFRGWFHSAVEKVLSAEEEYVDTELGFMGHPDLVVIIRGDSEASVIDLKTPLQKNPLWRPQIAAYKHLVEKANHKVKRTGSLRLSRKGGRAIFDEYTGSLGRDLAGFISALDAWKYFHHLKERMI